MKRQIFLLIIILHSTLYILHLPLAHAEGYSLSVSPSLLNFQINPPSDANSPLVLENQGEETLNVQVLLKPLRPAGETGQIEYLKDNEISSDYKKIFDKIHLTDNGIATTHFEIAPKQKKNLELQISVPKDEVSSDYYFSVIFLAGIASKSVAGGASLDSNPQDQNFSKINAGIATNVLLSVGSKKQPQGFIEEFSTPTLIQSGPVSFTVRVKNSGPHLFTPKGIVLIKNMFGQTVGRIDLESANILSNSIRSLADTQSASSSSQVTTDKAVWPEKLLLGPYTATLNLALSDTGPLYKQSIVFIAIPIQITISLIIAMLISIAIFFRVRYHLKKDK